MMWDNLFQQWLLCWGVRLGSFPSNIRCVTQVLMVFQLALGLLGLPVLACAASCLLDSLVAERTWELPEQSYLSESKHQRVMARNIELNSFANQQAMIRLPERLHVC